MLNASVLQAQRGPGRAANRGCCKTAPLLQGRRDIEAYLQAGIGA